ncbi:MAG: methionyl-tRNA formyltransferase [Paludibacteraceae bacterium]|nr:methionyl-tRNA formyltransferase [Paludibacteraceae bacterium]
MNKEDLKIVYMGTPDFAVEPLRRLVEEKYNVVGVVTMPDKPAGRGHKLQFSPVKQYAVDNNLHVMQPEKLKAEEFVNELRSLNADLFIVVAFRMLPEVVWAMPRLGTFNLHGSLLPQYRGAAPLNWAIINGEKRTGITTFFLTHEIDTGKIIDQQVIAIEDSDNVGTIHDKLMVMGGDLVIKTVKAILWGGIKPIPQEELYASESELKPAPKIFKETCHLDFNNPTENIHNLVRGLSPYPAAWANLSAEGKEDLQMKIYETKKEICQHNETPGTLVTDGKKFLKVATKDGYLHLLQIQVPGKKRLSIEDFLRGFRFDAEYKLS